MNHAENFERFIIQSEVSYDVIPLKDGSTGYRFYQQLENGPRLVLGVVFNPENTIADLTIFNIAKVTNPLKEDQYLNLINELNNNFRYSKFVKVDDEIQSNYSLPLYGNEDFSEVIFDLLIMLLRSVEDAFPKFMKLQWL